MRLTSDICSSRSGTDPHCLQLVLNAGYLLVNLDLFRFWLISLEIYFFTRNEAQEQHSLLDTISDYIFYFGPQGKYLYNNQEASRWVVCLGNFSINMFLEGRHGNIMECGVRWTMLLIGFVLYVSNRLYCL